MTTVLLLSISFVAFDGLFCGLLKVHKNFGIFSFPLLQIHYIIVTNKPGRKRTPGSQTIFLSSPLHSSPLLFSPLLSIILYISLLLWSLLLSSLSFSFSIIHLSRIFPSILLTFRSITL